MQSASLLSDMESFKAANPGAVLGDFVRWYSPRDWVDGEEKGDKVRIACILIGPTGFVSKTEEQIDLWLAHFGL